MSKRNDIHSNLLNNCSEDPDEILDLNLNNVIDKLFNKIVESKPERKVPEESELSDDSCSDLIVLKLIKTSQQTKKFVASARSYSSTSSASSSYSPLPVPSTVKKPRKKRLKFFTKMVSGVIATNSRQNQQDDPVRLKMLKLREEHAKKQKFDYSHVFRHKSRFDLMRLSIIIMGIDFAYAAETAFVSPILLEIGIKHEHMTMVWALSPLLGFFLSPLMGTISDRCRLAWGRRRPPILILSIGLFLGLLLVPYGKDVGYLLGDKQEIGYVSFEANNNSRIVKYNADELDSPENYTAEHEYGFKWAVLATVLGTVLLDFGADNCQTPSRAYLLDVCLAEDHAKALSTFTIMAGMGGFLGYSLGGIDWSETKIGLLFGGNVKTVFAIVTIIFIICVICTLTSFREIPLPLMERDKLLRPVTHADLIVEKERITKAHFSVKNRSEIQLTPSNLKVPKIAPIVPKDAEAASVSESSDDECEDPITLMQYLKSIVRMPKALRILCFTNLLSWMGYLSCCLYFTDFVAEAVFHGDPSLSSDKHALYEEGVRFGCWGLAVSALSCAIYSKIIEYLIKWFRAKIVYICGLLIFSVGMCILGTYPTKLGVLLLSITAGIIYATIFTIPFLLVANYHAKGSFKNNTGDSMAVQPTNMRGLGTDIAVVGSMLFLAQIIISLSIGALVKAAGTTKVLMWVASVCSLLASISATKVIYMDL